jgi:ribosomal protein L3 glutamine methyltransferase
MPAELQTLIDLIRYGGSRFNAAGLCFGHSYDNALDEATQLVLHALHLPHDLNPVYGQSRVTAAEKTEVLALFQRRIDERIPAAYLTGNAWFAGLRFRSDRRALVPRSPIAELIETGFEPWLGIEVEGAVDMCTGSGCIAIAMAHHAPDWRVDAVDLSPDALALAAENVAELEVGERVELLQGDLFDPVAGRRYQLIVSNPPYVTRDEVAALPQEYRFEPELGLIAGDDGLDLALRILRDAPSHLDPGGLLVVEVGESERALARLLPEVPFDWIEFKVGQMGVFAITREALAEHGPRITELADARLR